MLVQNLHLPTLKLCQRLALLAPLQDDMVPRLAIVNFKFLLDMVMHGTKATNRSLAEQDATAPGGNRRALAAPGDKIIDLNYDYSVVRLTARLAKGRGLFHYVSVGAEHDILFTTSVERALGGFHLLFEHCW